MSCGYHRKMSCVCVVGDNVESPIDSYQLDETYPADYRKYVDCGCLAPTSHLTLEPENQ